MNDQLTVAVLDQDEALLGYLDPEVVQVSEVDELGSLRSLTVTHPLLDTQALTLGPYATLLVHGNKLWRPVTGDGDSCLYVIIDKRTINPEDNTITVVAEEAATELSQLPPVRISGMGDWPDDFEDGLYNGYRDLKYPIWIVQGGTAEVTSTSPISGTYSLTHLGSGSDTLNNRMYWASDETDYMLHFNIKLLSYGAGGSEPYFKFFARYQDSNNYLALEIRYESSIPTMYVLLRRVVGGVSTILATYNWGSTRWAVGGSHAFHIYDSGSNFTFILDSTTMINYNYSGVTFSGTQKGLGGNYTTKWMLDDFSFTGNTPDIQTITVDNTFLTRLLGDYFTIGTVEGTETFTYQGTVGILALLREIESQTGYEFQFRYEWDGVNKRIIRYLDFLEERGETHPTPIEIGYNTGNITTEEDEGDVAIAASPVGAPSSTDTTENTMAFHQARRYWEGLAVSTTTQIPLWVTKDSDGVEVNGPLVYPPYNKLVNTNYVSSLDQDESSANYQEVQKKDGTPGSAPRTVLFESTETNKYNLYWLCVDKIRECLHPKVAVDAEVVDIQRLQGGSTAQYNVGDTVPIQLPDHTSIIMARVTKTVKDPRTPAGDTIELGNYVLDFYGDYLRVGRLGKSPFIEV